MATDESGLRNGEAVLARYGAVLQPWQVHFKLMESVLANNALVHVDLGVDVVVKRPWRENVLHTREALELLALIAFVEKKTAEVASATTKTVKAPHIQHQSPSNPRRYVLNCFNRACVQQFPDIEVFKAFFFAFDESSLRDEFRSALEHIYGGLTPEMKREVASNWHIPVQFFMSTTRHGPNLSKTYLTSALGLAKGVSDRARQAKSSATAVQADADSSWRYQFPYTDTFVRLSITRCKLEPNASSALAQLLALGVEIKEPIAIGNASMLGSLALPSLGPVLNALTDVASLRASEDYEKLFQDDRGVLSLQNWAPFSNAHARFLQAIASSLAVSKDFTELQLSSFGGGFSSKSRQKVLQWVAYALFSNESTSNITSLTLNEMLLEYDDVVSLIQVLGAKQPAMHLLDDAGDHVPGDGTDPGFAVVKAGTTISIAPVDDNSQGQSPTMVFKQDGRFRVMRNDTSRDAVDIIVPHYGSCIVPRLLVDHFEPAATMNSSAVPGGYDGSITSLKVKDSSHRMLLPLITYVGPKLLSLELGGNIDAEFLGSVLAACPNLEKLTVLNPAEHMESALMEAYESGKCKISWVRIFEYSRVQEDPTTTEDFILTLEDPTTQAAKTVRRLELRTVKGGYFDESILDVAVEMLKVNRTIEYFHYTICDSSDDDHPEAPLMETNGLKLPPYPLPPASCLAFLSVLRQYSPSKQSIKPSPRKRSRFAPNLDIAKLDINVISSIFAFAAQGAVRRVEVNVDFL